MNLAVDIGNSQIKAAVFEQKQIVELFKAKSCDSDFINFIDSIFNAYPNIEAAILASSRDNVESVEEALKSRVKRYVHFDSSVKVPIKNLYSTPSTLGSDRLASAVGANALYNDSNVVIFDFGTAITIDVVNSDGEFIGGNISPGANTRFKALHHFTNKLPLCELTENIDLIANSTSEAIESGVINGILFEIEGYITRLSHEYDDLKIIFTGGDSNFFAKRLKNTIFATYDLVVFGLNRILEYNAD